MTRTNGNEDGKVSFRLLTSLITSARGMLAQGLGEMFQGNRNLYTTFGYETDVTYAKMLKRYERQDIVSRIVNAYPDAIWTRPPEIIDNEKLSKALKELDAGVSLYHYINRVDRLAGIGKYAVLLLGFNDVSDVVDLETPVGSGGGVKLIYVQAFGYGDAAVNTYEEDAASPYFGMPATYKITLRTNTADKSASQSIVVHRSRVIHVADCTLNNDVEGYPILERVYNRLDDVEKTVGGSAEMYWMSGRKGMQVDIDKDTQYKPEDLAKLKSELEDFSHNLQRYIRTQGVTIKDLGGQHVNPEPVFNVIMSIISVTTGIPQRIFIGSEQGKLASEQDRANWALRIDERRVLYAEPKILRPLLTRLQEFGVLPKGSYTFEWPEAFRMSPLERAQTAAQQARSATNVARAYKDFQKPVEGIDYALRRPTAVMSGGGGGFGKKGFVGEEPSGNVVSLLEAAPGKAKTPAATGKTPADKSGGNTPPPAPEPKPLPMEEILIKPKELLTVDEARQIIFARGELLKEGGIAHVMD